MDSKYKQGSELARGDGQPINPKGGDRDINGPVPDEDKRAMEEPRPKLLTKEEAKSALVQLASSKFFYRKRAANEMSILNIKPTSAYHFCLESFTETRSTTSVQEPYTGGSKTVDTSANGPAPSSSEVQVHAKEAFKDEKKVLEVPHTASVQECKKCNGIGRVMSMSYYLRDQPTQERMFRANTVTTGLDGRILHDREQCSASDGHVSMPSIEYDMCSMCKGATMVKTFVQLTVEWVNHVSHYVFQKEVALPEELVRGAQGQIVFKEQNPWVYPISQCPEPSINKASMELLTKHKKDYKNERLLQQRQTVKIVPVSKVQCQWEGESFTQYVYGIENQSYCSDYPQKCNIL